jgi:predicted nucleic acid-binding protein
LITAIDTNVLVALLGGTTEEARAARLSLEEASARGLLVISAPVYAELVAAPGRGTEAVDTFLRRARIGVDWTLSEGVWRAAAEAFRGYAERRRSQPGDPGPRRILADFIVGAHALRLASALLTLDQGIYRAAFPDLEILTPA